MRAWSCILTAQTVPAGRGANGNMVNYKCIRLPIQHMHKWCKRLCYNTLSIKPKISTVPSLKCRIFCQIYTVTGGQVLGVHVRLRKEAAIADGGLQPEDKTKGSPKLQRAPQAAGENSTLMQRQGGNSSGAVRRHSVAPWCPVSARPEGRGTGEPRTSTGQRRSFLLTRAASPAPRAASPSPASSRRGAFSRGTRAAPPPGPQAGAFPLRDPKREQPPPPDPAKPRQPRGGCSPPGPPWPPARPCRGPPVPPPPPLTRSGEQAGHAPGEEEDGADEAQLLQQHLPPPANFPQHKQHGLRRGERRLLQLHRSERGRRGGGQWVGGEAGITPGGFPRTAPFRSGCSAKISRCPGPQVGSGAAEGEAGGGGRGGGGSPERGGGAALRGRAEPRAPWPAAEEAARRRPALLGQRPPHSAPRAASQRRGTDTSMRLPARPAKFEVYAFPPSLPRRQP